jgi:hypothetical protein
MWIILRQHANGETRAFGPMDADAARERVERIAYPTDACLQGDLIYMDKADPYLSFTLLPLERMKEDE